MLYEGGTLEGIFGLSALGMVKYGIFPFLTVF